MGNRPEKDAMIRVRVPSDLKAAGDEILRRDGISQSQAVRLIWAEMVKRGRFPFSLDIEAAEREAGKMLAEDR